MMMKSAVLLLGLLTSVATAFDYSLTGAGGITIDDVISGISGIKTLFLGQPVAVTVTGIEWEANGSTETTGTLTYTTFVDGEEVATGTVDLGDVGRTLPDSISAGEAKVSSNGRHTISVTLTVDDSTADAENSYQAYRAGVSIIPLIVVFVFAAFTAQVELSLGAGIGLGATIIAGNLKDGFKDTLATYIVGAVADEGHVFVIIFSLFLAGLVGMMEKSGGFEGFTALMSKFATTVRTGSFVVFFSGCLIFFDDYANILLVGESLRPLMDLLHMSREKLAFIVDATAAPIASISPISSWVGFEVDLIQTEIDAIIEFEGTDDLSIETSGLAAFLQSIKYRYYPIFMLFIIPAIIFSKRDFGPMLIAERKTQVYRRTDGGDGAADTGGLSVKASKPDPDTPARSWNMFFPIAILVFFILYILIQSGDDGSGTQSFLDKLQASDSFVALLWGTMAAAIVTEVFFLLQFKKDGELLLPMPNVVLAAFKGMFAKPEFDEDGNEIPTIKPLLGVYDSIHAFLAGMARIFSALVVLTLAWAVGEIMKDVGTNRLFSGWIVDTGLDSKLLPTLSFLISAIMAVATGTSWGTMTIMFPLIMFPTWRSAEGDATIWYATCAGILSGSVAGDHSSPIADTTVLTSLACQCDLLSHTWTQAPYALVVSILSILVGTLPIGYAVWPNIVGILLGLGLCIAFVYLVGKPIISPTGNFDIFTSILVRPGSELYKLKEDTAAAFEGAAPAVKEVDDPEKVEKPIVEETPLKEETG